MQSHLSVAASAVMARSVPSYAQHLGFDVLYHDGPRRSRLVVSFYLLLGAFFVFVGLPADEGYVQT
jgi:hypothetical protein